MKLLEPDYKDFLLGLNRLRKDVCHSIRYIDFSLRRYVDGLSDAEFRATARSLGAGFKDAPIAQFPVSSFSLPKSRTTRHVNTVRECFWNLSPRASLWNSGAWTLDLLSLQWHFEDDGQVIRRETDIEGQLQDLLLDPKVLDYRRKLHKRLPEAGA
jgi:hypothetical protein